jgi:guanine nucleotide-binding protein G(I)/G(S)/G(T) subunit beta-1
MTDVNSRIEAAKAEIQKLKTNIEHVLASKTDATLGTVGASKQGMLSPIRSPPQCRVRRTLKGHFGKITALHWAGDSQMVVSASQDGNLLVWNAVTCNKTQSMSLKSSYVMSVGVEQSKGSLIACGGLDNLCTIYKVGSSEVQTEMASHDGFLSCCRFIDEEYILTSSGDSTCLLWNIENASVKDTFAEHSSDAMFISLRPNDRNVFVSASVDTTTKLWDIRTPSKSQQTFYGHSADVNCVDFMPSDSNAFATCSEDGTLRIFDIRAYNEVQRLGVERPLDPEGMPPPTGEGMTSVACSKSGRLIFAGHSDASVLAYDTLSSRPMEPTFIINQAHDNHISCVGVSPNGDALCTGSWDYVLKIWA